MDELILKRASASTNGQKNRPVVNRLTLGPAGDMRIQLRRSRKILAAKSLRKGRSPPCVSSLSHFHPAGLP